MTSLLHVTKPHLVLIKDMTPLMKNFECEVIVLQKDPEPNVTRNGDEIYKALVADRSASINLSIFGTKGSHIKHGDILRIRGAQSRVYQGHLNLTIMKEGDIKRIGQDTFFFVEKPNLSEADVIPIGRVPNKPFRQEGFPEPQRAVNTQRLAAHRPRIPFARGRKQPTNPRDLDQPENKAHLPSRDLRKRVVDPQGIETDQRIRRKVEYNELE